MDKIFLETLYKDGAELTTLLNQGFVKEEKIFSAVYDYLKKITYIETEFDKHFLSTFTNKDYAYMFFKDDKTDNYKLLYRMKSYGKI